jgi:predicted transcriptional regulator
MRDKNKLSRAELEVMKVLWESGKVTVKDVQEALKGKKSWGYTTVMTLLVRMHNKGYLKREKIGMAYVYEPKVTEKKTIGKIVNEFVDRVFDGALGPLVNYIAESKELNPDEMETLKRLAKTLDKGVKRND